MSYAIGERFVARQIGDSVVVVEYETGVYWTLNETATAIWKAATAGTTAPAIAEDLVAAFEISPGEATSDVEAFLRHCVERAMLVPSA